MRPVYLFPFALLACSSAFAQQCAQPLSLESPSEPRLPGPSQHGHGDTDAIAHLGARGATVEMQPNLHGFETGIAHIGEGEILVFFAPTDHKVILSGTLIPVPYDTLRHYAGGRARDLVPSHGIRGMFVQAGNRFQIVYATPDGQAAVAARMWDATGKDLTKAQIRDIPGAVPAVTVSASSSHANTRSGLADLSGGSLGVPSAPEAVMFIDPQCIYSIRAMRALQPAIGAGRIRLKVVPLSLLDYEDHGASTINAKSMLSFPEGEMAEAWISGRLGEKADNPSPDSPQKLAHNSEIARQLALAGTPTFIWTRRNGETGRLDGVPRDVEAFISSVSQ
ncbi:thioredoxin domain-containing protein [Acetobacter sicerae]|uniref:thiol:disulfide interchange protein n=1 Tax=Acetobacter sicerae TaxID=85325 RepID=UPI00156AA99E|nr:thiol:disulfide interchange protein [Acetobacter sicerae]NHN93185.1 thiol:disulfide interchange protein [Acetobacter sicerae]